MADGNQGAGESRQMQRKHVFVVNGASEFLEIIRDLLEDEHFNVTTTNYVPRTFDQINVLQPDLIILDLVVGKQAGWDLLERQQAEATTHGIPVLLVSTDPQLLDRARSEPERYGVHRSVAKPMDLEDLLDAVHAAIGGA
jgi:DNA-binding response OmpR family regulator